MSDRIRIGLAAHQLLVTITEGHCDPRLCQYFPLGRGIFKTGFVFVFPDLRVEEVIAFDNSTGENFMESFKNINEAYAWLKSADSTPSMAKVEPKDTATTQAHHIKETCINPCCLDDVYQDTDDLIMFGIVDDSLFIIICAAMTALLGAALASVFGWGL